MSNCTENPPFVKYKFYRRQEVQIRSLCDFRTKRYPHLRTIVNFTIDDEPHHLILVDFGDGVGCHLDEALDALPLEDRIELSETLLEHEPQWRARHPEKIAMLIDYARLAEVQP